MFFWDSRLHIKTQNDPSVLLSDTADQSNLQPAFFSSAQFQKQ